jgi:UPF0755 protein
MKDLYRTWLPAALAGAAVAALAGCLIYFWSMPAATGTRVVDIPAGTGTAAIGRLLQKNNVIRSVRLFRLYAGLTRQTRRLQAGEYAFPAGTHLGGVLRILASGATVRHTLTVPEGFTARQIADKLTAEGWADGNAFLAAVHNRDLARAWELPGETLEGFLFPDTYEISKNTPAQTIAQRMVERFRSKVGAELLQAGAAHKLNELQFVTLASIIEREVKVPAERTKVASVFYNRLRRGMRLESCATVLYSLNRTSGALSLNDLAHPSPYNTYRRLGLPPGPIGNPGLSSLTAAAYPAQTDYLFFVVRPDGQHVFSSDFESHKHAKWAQERARKNQNAGAAPARRP